MDDPTGPMDPFDTLVERIARALYERPCPPEEGPNCNPDVHNWATVHPEDRAHTLDTVAFVLKAV